MAVVNTNLAPLLKEGSNVTLIQDGQVITIASTGGGGGTPGGVDTQIQFNDGGAFGGDAGLTYDKTNNIVDLESIDFATTPTAGTATYRLNVDDGEGSINLGLKGGNVNIALGADVIILSHNAEATTLNKGEVVYLYGASGQRPSVKRADNTSDATSASTFGMVAESIASGAEGFVVQLGIVKNLNTNSYNEGDILYLGTSGGVTTTKQYAPIHNVFVGVVLKKSLTAGRIFVKPQNGYELDEIHNVSAQSPSNNDIIAYNTTTSLWEKKQLSAISGVTGTGTTNYLPKFTGTSTIGNSQVRDDGTGVAIGGVPSAFKLDVTGLVNFTGTTASDGGQLGAELLSTSGWTSTGWTGSFGAGWTHTTGNTTALTNTLAAVNGNYYQITYTVTGRTAGSFTLAFGGYSVAGITATGNTGPQATSTGTLSITPTTDFDGTIVLSIKVITAGSANLTIKNSTGTVINEINGSSSNTNTFIGLDSGSRNTTGFYNTFLGSSSGLNNTNGTDNSFFGYISGQSNTTGSNNTFLGSYAGWSNTTGGFNTFVGSSGRINTTGNFNCYFGARAGISSTTTSGNCFFGYEAGRQTTGSTNSFYGYQSGTLTTSGSNNVGFGLFSGLNNTTGSNNSFFGSESGRRISSGSNLTVSNNSVFLGYDTRANADSETNQTVIGYAAIGLGSNTTVIGNSSTTYGRWWGNLLVGTSTNAGYALDVSGTARIQSSPAVNSDSSLYILPTTNNSTASATLYGVRKFSTISTINSSSSYIGFSSANNASSNTAAVSGFESNVNVSAGTTTTARTFISNSAVTGTGTITTHIGYDYVDVFKGGSGVLTRQFGVRINNIVNGSSANVGLLFNDSGSTSVNGTWDIYSQSNNNSYLKGNLLLNSTTDSGYKLDVNGTTRTQGDFTISDTKNIILGTTTGTKIGTATTQKIGFFNATPVVQPSAYTQTYSTATKTHNNLTSSDLTGITSSTTGSTLAEPSIIYTQSEMQQNFRAIQDQYNALKTDLTNLKQIVNQIIDDHQSLGLLG